MPASGLHCLVRYNASMMIDFHTHAFPDEIADRAIAALEGEIEGIWKAKLDGRVSSLLGSMDAAGIERSIVCPIATKAKQFPGILDWCLAIRSERIIPLASVHPDAPDLDGEFRRIVEAGLIGIKLHPMYQNFQADESRMDEVYGRAAEHGLLVLMHCGYDIAFPGNEQSDPVKIAAALDRHPDMLFIATHLAGWNAWDKAREHLTGRPNLWPDTSFSLHLMSEGEAERTIRALGVERTLFGTDSPWADQSEEVARIRQLPLTDEEKDAILGGNAQRLLASLKPR